MTTSTEAIAAYRAAQADTARARKHVAQAIRPVDIDNSVLRLTAAERRERAARLAALAALAAERGNH